MSFEPEVGQAIFGQPYKEHSCSSLVEAALQHIADELDRVMWNINQAEYASPFDNTGNSFICDTFEAHAYSWSDEVQPFNFKWRDVEISWYKRMGRGMSANQKLLPEHVAEMLDSCLSAVRDHEKQHSRFVSEE